MALYSGAAPAWCGFAASKAALVCSGIAPLPPWPLGGNGTAALSCNDELMLMDWVVLNELGIGTGEVPFQTVMRCKQYRY
jgi:hypothetical protein